MAKDILLYPFRNQLKKYFGGRDKLYPYMEAFNTIDIVKLIEDDFIVKMDTGTFKYVPKTNGTSAAVTGSVASTANGVCRLTTGTDDNGYAGIAPNYGGSLAGACAFGDLSAVIWGRVKLSAITTVKLEFGFTDSDADAGAVATLATPTMTASDAAVWCFDTDDTNYAGWQGVTVGSTPYDAASHKPSTAIAPVAATYEWLGVAIQGDSVKFMHADQYGNPDYESAWQVNKIEGGTALVPWIFAQARAGSASRTADLDFWIAYQRRVATDS